MYSMLNMDVRIMKWIWVFKNEDLAKGLTVVQILTTNNLPIFH